MKKKKKKRLIDENLHAKQRLGCLLSFSGFPFNSSKKVKIFMYEK